MKHTLKITMTVLTALGLTACGGDTKSEMDHSKMDHADMKTGEMDHAKMGHNKIMGDTGHTTGVVFSISPDGSEATINHKEIEGVGMGAMTMGFGITSTVDLSEYTKGDTVSFAVKKGRDGSYRITAICNTYSKGADCLNGLIKNAKAPTDYKAMFGPNYQKGDIGHSKGVVEGADTNASSITIAHGIIHGIGRKASTTTFAIPATVALENIAPGSRVEFLVKKVSDDAYGLFKICALQGSSDGCLKPN